MGAQFDLSVRRRFTNRRPGAGGPAGYFVLPADGGGWPDAALFGYSDLSVTMGSTRVARQAGTSVATMPTINMIAATALKVPGSC